MSEDATMKIDPAAGQSEIIDVQAPAESPEAELVETLRKEIAELQQQNLRLIAEMQNQQRRVRQEKEDALRFAESGFARDLLNVLDDLERTQESAPTATDIKTVAEGVRITYEQFLKVLKSRGIEPIAARGAAFDPSVHEALLQQPSADTPAGVVLQEVARGWKMHERVLRPSRVIISSGPPAT